MVMECMVLKNPAEKYFVFTCDSSLISVILVVLFLIA